ncbi:MAG: DUF5115 domain-containing protein [Bacteroidaceae bacterium]|nr:DUF5115 domain-containing protein [Bacteroidaceae bacterium]
MKKIFFSLMAIASLAFVGCKGDYDDWAEPQHNDQEQPADVQMKVEVQGVDNVIEMEELADAELVQLFVPVKVESNVDATYVLNLSDELGNSQDFVPNAEGFVSKEEVENMINNFYGKKQVERVMNGQLIANYVKDGATMKAVSDKFLVRILPAVPEMNYWIYGKQNNRNEKEKTMPLMPVTKESQTVTTYFSGMLDTKMWSDESFGNAEQVYGAQGSSNKKAMTGEFAIGGGYICPTSAGWYTLTFNFATYQYNFTRLENQEPTAYTSVSLIGDFNTWGSDLALTQVVSGTSKPSHCWYALGVELMTAGGLKFRADSDWAVNWGADQNVKDASYGTGTQDGPNITVPAGTYDVYFNDITGEFLFIVK